MLLRQRWSSLTNDELVVLWDALTMDDGIRYGIEEDDQPTHGLATELHAEADRRGLAERDPGRWGHSV